MKHLKNSIKELIALFLDFEPKSLDETKRTQKVLRGLSMVLGLNVRKIHLDRDLSITYSILRRKISAEVWENWIVRRVFYNFHMWQYCKSPTKHIYLDLLNYIKNVLLPENYPLHRAVLESKLYKIRQICIGEDCSYFYINIDEADMLGNTALMLAVKLSLHDQAQVLIDHGADPKYRITSVSPSPLEQAIAMEDKSMLYKLVSGYHRELHSNWNDHVEEFSQVLSSMPDFSLNMNWECTSNFIPFIKKFTPSDEYHICKKGRNLKIDLTLVGWEQLKAKRGKLSLLFFGRHHKVVIFDHKNNSSRELFADLNCDQIEKHTEVNYN